jgi:hypothetical protein
MNDLKVTADIRKNRLYFNFLGIAAQKEMEKLYTNVRFCVADLKPGFDVISDFSECKLIQLNSISALKKIMTYLIENGLGEIVRVLHSENISHKQILNLATRVQGYKPIYVFSLEEAEERLENNVKRNGLRVHLHNLSITYLVDKEEGNGTIIDMSTSGCAVEFTTFRPEIEMEMLIKFTFTNEDNSPVVFEIKAKVIRVSKNVFAAEFTDLDNASKEILWKCLIRESRR